MDVKDQRFEMRIPQQQLDELDAIRASAGSPYPLTRSDIGRMFIAQGIERYKQGQAQLTNQQRELSLGERLAIFYQLEQIRLQGGRYPVKSATRQSNEHTPIEDFDLVENISQKRYFWFFELDQETLKVLGGEFRFQRDSTRSLFDRQPNVEVCRNLRYVCEVVRTFSSIEKCMREAEHRDAMAELITKLSLRHDVPLEFPGFPASAEQLNEMAALVRWLDENNSDRGFRPGASEKDYTAFFNKLLVVYRDLTKGQRKVDLQTLHEIIMESRGG